MNSAFVREKEVVRDKILKTNFKSLLCSLQTGVSKLGFQSKWPFAAVIAQQGHLRSRPVAHTHSCMFKDTKRIFTQQNLSSGISSS